MMSRHAAFVLLLAFGAVFQLSSGIEVNFTKDDKLCLYANLMLNFSVSYEVAGNKSQMAVFELPANAASDESVCDTTSSLLKLDFEGNSWSVNFTMNEKSYQASLITFSYNLSDSKLFPDSVSNDTKTVTVKPQMTNIDVDTCYSCLSKDMIEADLVNMTLWNVLIQAFVTGGSKSENLTHCAADIPATTVAPTTHTTSTTTAAPVTNTSTAPPPTTTTPTPTLPPPTTGKYSFKPDENSTACLLAYFGLRIGVKQGDKHEEMNFEPNGTHVSGSCGVNSSELTLVSNSVTIVFTFTNDTKKFHLHALNVTGKTSSGLPFSEVNTNMSQWEATLGSSYMCNKEQNFTVASLVTFYTFNVQVQPFGVKKGLFSTAKECSLDDTSILIPIIVGAALAGLILIVVIAYVIGRRKTYVGYQTL
ncbi:lysosome-associated membrane glycoprotein 2 [Stegastes partitus]|uniref:Lysosomal associated membrane protein 2 n=1 Tax=Stegastes partitus TaxID=144197 RepID=A0A3B5AHM2_9TELE|nr:PREDICTED: lysosome-associated membrane glycoprotein 2 [Stegastes partitus]